MVESSCWKEGTKRCVCMIHSATVVAVAVPIAVVHVCNFCAPSGLWSKSVPQEYAVQPDRRGLLGLQVPQGSLALPAPQVLQGLPVHLVSLVQPGQSALPDLLGLLVPRGPQVLPAEVA